MSTARWNEPEPACLVLADISGYTSYLAGVELDHAQDILADLLSTVVAGLRPTFRLAKLEGDAAFAWVPADRVDGSVLQDVVERTYVDFRRRLRDVARATRCDCDACTRMPALDLKFVVHHGPVVRQRVAGRDELLGRDVILVHRLLKNEIAAATGIRAYAAYTKAWIAAAGIEDPVRQGLVEHRETVDVIGEVVVWVRDLELVWEAEQEASDVAVRADGAVTVYRYHSPLPPAITWEFVTSPAHRPTWAGMDELRENAPGGRRGAGTVNHCVHGPDVLVEEVLEWRPFRTLTTRLAVPMPRAPKIVATDVLTPTDDGGTDVELRIGPPKPRERAAFERLLAVMEPNYRAAIGGLAALLEREAAERTSVIAQEPEVPESRRRYEREPIRAGGGSVDSDAGRSSGE
jgi:uncharacterized protein YndB with AHSA1/START domain